MTTAATAVAPHHAWAMPVSVWFVKFCRCSFFFKFCFKVIKLAGQLGHLSLIRVVITVKGIQFASFNDNFLAGRTCVIPELLDGSKVLIRRGAVFRIV